MTYRDILEIQKQLTRMAETLEHPQMHDHDEHDHEMDEAIQQVIESDEYSKSDAAVADACGPTRPPDEVESSITVWIEELRKAGYHDGDAQEAVFDAFANLVETNVLPDTPDFDDPLPTKRKWIESFNSVIRDKLLTMGLEF